LISRVSAAIARRILAGVAFPLMSYAVIAVAEPPEFARLVRAQGAAVVNISAVPKARAGDESSFAAHAGSADPLEASLGSGFIVSSDGYVMTCAHVVDNAREVIVRLVDRRELSAKLIGIDARTDIALLKVDAGRLPTVSIGDPDKLSVGDWVLAIGSPFGFHHSATSGIVSAKGRSLPQESYIPFIQTDVAINPGNSGGPLFNLRGEVVGVNSEIVSRDGGFMGVSFAVPIDLAMSIADKLKRGEQVRRGWLGVSLQEVTSGLAFAYGLSRPRGALVSDILVGGPATKSELRAGDIVVDFDGRQVEYASELAPMVARARPGTHAKVVIQRRGVGTRELFLDIGELREPARPALAPDVTKPGLSFAELGERQRREEGLNNGVVIKSIDAVARQAGLRPGDVVVEMDGKRVHTVSELQRALEAVPAGVYAVLRVRRGAQAQFVAIRPGN
jgi:serine protease Do